MRNNLGPRKVEQCEVGVVTSGKQFNETALGERTRDWRPFGRVLQPGLDTLSLNNPLRRN
jgi:hypothetical protein